MRRVFLFILTATVTMFLAGCRSIHLGGSGDVGGIHGSSGVNIPLPK